MILYISFLNIVSELISGMIKQEFVKLFGVLYIVKYIGIRIKKVIGVR